MNDLERTAQTPEAVYASRVAIIGFQSRLGCRGVWSTIRMVDKPATTSSPIGVRI